MSFTNAVIITTLSSTFLLTLVYYYVFRQYHERYLAIWFFSWLSYALSYVLTMWMLVDRVSPLLLIFHQIFIFTSGLLLIWGTYEFLGGRIPSLWAYALFPGTIWIGAAVLAQFPYKSLTLPTYTLLGVGYIWTGFSISRHARFQGVGKHLTGTAFTLWGLHKLSYPHLGSLLLFASWGFYLLTLILEFLVAIGILLIFFDKTSRDLRASEQRFRLLAENARDVIFRYVLRPSLGCEYASPAAQYILGFSPEAFYREPALIFAHIYPNDQKLLKNLLRTPQSQVGPLTLRWVKQNKAVSWLELSCVPICEQSGRLVAVEGIARDITERTMVVQRAARAERLASMGAMAAGIAHEINQPLNSLSVIVEGMLFWYEKYKSLDTDKTVNNLLKVSQRINRIDSIIKHMHSFVRNENSAQLSPCDLNKALAGALQLIGSQLKAHGIQLRNTPDINLPAIMGENLRLEEIIINLLLNALQALDSVGESPKIIACRTYAERSMVILEIKDNGPGIREEIKDKIFEPFFTTRPNQQGMGLGLFIASSLVTYYNGLLTVTDNEWGGATFRIEFPAITANPNCSEVKYNEHSSG